MKIILVVLWLTGNTPTVEKQLFTTMAECTAVGLTRVKALQKRPEVTVLFAECGISKLHTISN